MPVEELTETQLDDDEGYMDSVKPLSRDVSSSAGRDSFVNSTVSFLKSNKDLLLGLFLGVAVIEGAALFYEWRHLAQQQELKRYELSDFITTHFNPLEAKVSSDHDLIQAYGIAKTIECRSK